MPRRERFLFVCNNRRPDGNPKGSCAQSGSEAIHKALKEEIVRRGLASTKIRACTSSCLDICEVGPTIYVSPDDYFLGRVTIDDVPAIVDAIAEGKRLESRVVDDASLRAPKEVALK
jgi:(2Fe-2S) ferredoxin